MAASTLPNHDGPRSLYFSNAQQYLRKILEDAQTAHERNSSLVGQLQVELYHSKSIGEMCEQLAALADAERTLAHSRKCVEWLQAASAVPGPTARTLLASKPTWSYAGNLRETARDIEALLMQTVPVGRGTKSDLPMVYVWNPPRQGKSLLLDTLFAADADVCVLNVTYTAAAIMEDELRSAACALRGLLTRLTINLLFGDAHNVDSSMLFHSPLFDVDDPVHAFQAMLGLLDDNAPARLLICIDEVSKLLDDDRCTWARDPTKMEELKSFWRGIHSITRATPHWVRVAMTGFTDAPINAIEASGIECRPFALSMVSAPETELLAAEIAWAYAVENTEPFPNMLWTLVKATPGLLGVWAQQMRLHNHGPSSCYCHTTAAAPHQNGVKANVGNAMRTSNLGGMACMVPWVAVLIKKAHQNWPLIHQFLVEEDCPSPATIRAARNAELATMLGTRVALSPFAVAVSVLALRGQPLPLDRAGNPVGYEAFHFLDKALGACESHSAECAASTSLSWRATLQKRLQELRRDKPHLIAQSEILSSDPRLAPLAPLLPGPSLMMPSAVVQRVSDPCTLRLEYLRQAAHTRASSTVATQLLPPALSALHRPAVLDDTGLVRRHDVEISIAVVMPEVHSDTSETFLARLCTQTCALLLPSSVDMIMAACTVPDTSVSPATVFESALPLDLARVVFDYASVAVMNHSPGCTLAPLH